MPHPRFLLAGLSLSIALPLCGPAARAADSPSAQVDARVDALLARMTVEEKAGQLNQLAADTLTGPGRVVENGDELIRNGQVGSLFNVVKASENNAYQRMAVNGSRLHIPLLFGQDVIHGFHTLFPIPLGLSASWDPALVEQTARMAALGGLLPRSALDLLSHGGHRAGPALGPDRGGRR